MVVLDVDLAPGNPRELRLANPIIAASGCFGFGVELAGVVDLERIGAFISPSLTVRARGLDRGARLVPTPAGAVYANTLTNPGVRSFLRTYPRIWEQWTVPAIVSIAGESVDEFATLAETFDEVSGIAGVEINLSLPVRGGTTRRIGDDPDLTFEVVEAVRTSTSLPILVKLNSDPLRIAESAHGAQSGGADAITLVNAIDGLAIDIFRRRVASRREQSFLVGPAIKPIVLRQVYDVASAVEIPVIAGGGIASLDDALDYLLAGASAIQIGTAVFADPGLPIRLVEELRAWLETQGITRLEEIVGAAHSSRGDDVQIESEFG
jgi:dihydroorotate dehydrogenase (NAD+) catalytic subunit